MDNLIGSLKSKTAWFALILVMLGALQQNAEAVTAVIGAGNMGWFMSAIGAVVYVLRMMTSKPLDEK